MYGQWTSHAQPLLTLQTTRLHTYTRPLHPTSDLTAKGHAHGRCVSDGAEGGGGGGSGTGGGGEGGVGGIGVGGGGCAGEGGRA